MRRLFTPHKNVRLAGGKRGFAAYRPYVYLYHKLAHAVYSKRLGMSICPSLYGERLNLQREREVKLER